jgi:class 3 adenylate cyclase
MFGMVITDQVLLLWSRRAGKLGGEDGARFALKALVKPEIGSGATSPIALKLASSGSPRILWCERLQMYQPSTNQYDATSLPDRLNGLIERLAEQVHDTWAAQRMEDGWTYGPERSDQLKTHPCLQPYEQLPESEKKYDRLTAKQSIASIIEFGYAVVSPVEICELEVEEFLGLVENAGAPKELHHAWQKFQSIPSPERSKRAARSLVALAQKAFSYGELLVVHDACRLGLSLFPGEIDFAYRLGLCLAELDRQDEAIALIDSNMVQPDARLLSLQGRIHKDRFFASASKESSWIESACSCYRTAWELDPDDHFPLINLAACYVFAGNLIEAVNCASLILERTEDPGGDYYSIATRAEAALISGDLVGAARLYEAAASRAGSDLRDLLSTRKQAFRLAGALSVSKETVSGWFPAPSLFVFAGHILSEDDSGSMAEGSIPRVVEEIRSQLSQHDVYYSLASAASGSDLLFLEAIQATGAASHIFLPWPEDDFVETSVHPGWRLRFQSALQHASHVQTLSNHCTPELPASLEYTTDVMIGSALLMAERLGVPARAMAVWNGTQGVPGGTASFVSKCRARAIPIEIIELDESLSPAGEQVPGHGCGGAPQEGRASAIKAFLFSDVVGYSKFGEKQIPPFVEHFLQKLSVLTAGADSQPVICNTWGDALYAVFDSVNDAAVFALRFRDMVERTRWEDYGLPEDLGLRIGLHAGPAFSLYDPVIEKKIFTGFHTSWAARIEPVTLAGEIFCSEEFAALAALDSSRQFKTQYVGTFDLAKKFARKRLYRIRGGA